MNEINENNIQSYLGLDIIAVYDIFSCNDIFVLCRDGRQYILRGLSEKSLNMLLPQIFCAEDEKEMFRWVLENRLQELCARLRDISRDIVVILLDDSCNPDVDNVFERYSYGFVVKEYIEGLARDGKDLDKEKPAGPMTDDPRIVTLHHGYKNPPLDSEFYADQCDDLSERVAGFPVRVTPSLRCSEIFRV